MLTEVLPAVTSPDPAGTAYIEDSTRVRFTREP
jgi:hypothetical protein